MPVYAVTLWEPWATLIALGIKTFETRSWPAPMHVLGTRIAIHAAKRKANLADIDLFYQELRPHFGLVRGKSNMFTTKFIQRALPYGCVVATAVLAENIVVPAERVEGIAWDHPSLAERIRADARYGDFTPGRVLWRLEDVQKLEQPFPVTGQRGFWGVTLPDLHSTPRGER